MLGTRLNRASIDKNRRTIQTCHGHHTARHILVTTADRHETVESFARHDGFDRISDNLPGDKRVPHSRCPHRNAVGNGNSIEYDGFTPGGIDTSRCFVRQFIDMHVARRNHAPGRCDPDLALAKIRFTKTNGPEHRAAWRSLYTIDNNAGISALPVVIGTFLIVVLVIRHQVS